MNQKQYVPEWSASAFLFGIGIFRQTCPWLRSENACFFDFSGKFKEILETALFLSLPQA